MATNRCHRQPVLSQPSVGLFSQMADLREHLIAFTRNSPSLQQPLFTRLNYILRSNFFGV